MVVGVARPIRCVWRDAMACRRRSMYWESHGAQATTDFSGSVMPPISTPTALNEPLAGHWVSSTLSTGRQGHRREYSSTHTPTLLSREARFTVTELLPSKPAALEGVSPLLSAL